MHLRFFSLLADVYEIIAPLIQTLTVSHKVEADMDGLWLADRKMSHYSFMYNMKTCLTHSLNSLKCSVSVRCVSCSTVISMLSSGFFGVFFMPFNCTVDTLYIKRYKFGSTHSIRSLVHLAVHCEFTVKICRNL